MNALFENRWFLFDYARGRSLIKNETRLLFEVLKKAGYNGVCLHLEGFFEISCYPGVIRDGYFKLSDARWFCNLAKEYNMEVVPIINLVAHAESFVYYQERFADMRRADSKSQLNLFNSELESFGYKIIDEVIDIYRPKYLHIGGDETKLNDDEKTLYVELLSKFCKYIRQKGIEPCIWGDMLLSSNDIIENFTKDVTVFDWYYYGHRKSSLEKLKKFGFNDIFACPCDQGWDGFIGTQHHFPWGKWPKDEQHIEFNEVEAFLSDAAELGIKNALLTDWENNNGHNLWSQMDSIVRAGLYMSGEEISSDSIERCLFDKQTPHSQITYLLQNVQNELYMAVLENQSEESLKSRNSDAFFVERIFEAWLNISEGIITKIQKIEPELYTVQKLLSEWNVKNEIEITCKSSLYSTLCYAKALFALIKLGSYGYNNYHEAALLQFEAPKKSAQCLNNTAEYLLKLINDVESFKEMHQAYLNLCGQTRVDIVRLEAFCSSMSVLKEKIVDISEHILAQSNDIKNMKVIPSWQMLISNIDKFEIIV